MHSQRYRREPMRVAAEAGLVLPCWYPDGDQHSDITDPAPHSMKPPSINRRTLLLLASHIAVAALVGGAVAGVFISRPSVTTPAAAAAAGSDAASPAARALLISSMQLVHNRRERHDGRCRAGLVSRRASGDGAGQRFCG